MKAMPKWPWRRKAQSLVEFALGSILIVSFLAAAADLGRAYFTYVAVQQMAGEGALYLATYPEADKYLFPALPANMTFQERARNVGVESMGGIIDPTRLRLPSPGNPGDIRTDTALADRCRLTRFQVAVSYDLNDLFIPGMLGFNHLNIGGVAYETFARSTTPPNNCP